MRGAYLLVLIASLGCTALIDFRFRLAWWYDARRTARTLLLGIVLFIMWDIVGIALGIFFIGQTNNLIGLHIGQFPIEELFFLMLLCYSSLLIIRYLEQGQKKS